MKNTLLIIFILSALCDHSFAKDYTYYYRQTQFAEEYLLDGEFEKALQHYDSAFRDYDFKFARDCYIAAQTAAYLQNHSATYQYLQFGLQAGLHLKCLLRTDLFTPFRQTSYYQKLAGEEQYLWQQYLNRIDTNLNKELKRRYEREQYAKNKDREAYFPEIDDNVRWIDSPLGKDIYPGEKIAGIANTLSATNTPEIPGRSNCHYSAEYATPSLQHFPYSFDMLHDRLFQVLKNGEINPRELAYIFIFSKSRQCIYRSGKPDYIKEFIENTPYKNVTFLAPFEKTKTTIQDANRNRYDWFLPRFDTKYKAGSLYEKYGINIQIGDTFEW